MIGSIPNRVEKTYGSYFPLFQTNQLQRLNHSLDFKELEDETLRQTLLFPDLNEALVWKPNTFYGIQSLEKLEIWEKKRPYKKNVGIKVNIRIKVIIKKIIEKMYNRVHNRGKRNKSCHRYIQESVLKSRVGVAFPFAT